MLNIKGRIKSLEHKLGEGGEGKTLEALLNEFENGQYGGPSIMSLAVAAKSGHLENSLKKMPAKLAEYFREALPEAERAVNPTTQLMII